jgi:DNA-binding CsgD family transcriptional regulator/tetratricopeptide (TPR) repeat protein
MEDQGPSKPKGLSAQSSGLAPEGRLSHHPAMSTDTTENLVSRGHEALASGDWDSARDAFTAAVERGPDPEASDGLGRTLWWLGDVDGAIDHRERAYASFRKRGDAARAARIALWLAREYVEAVGNEPAGNGWLARAQGLLRDIEPDPAHGWLDLTLGSRSFDPAQMRAHAETALGTARRFDDAELEASSLALLGRALLLGGESDAGVASLDESMVAATGGEVTDPVVFGDICCVVTLACEESGELERLFKWNEIIETFMARHLHGPLISFCGSCGAEFFQAKGDFAMAERCVAGALEALEGTGHRSRCIHPAAKLAELRILQGRTEKAERLLIGYEDLPVALGANVAIHRSKGEHSVAAALLLRRLNEVGDTVVAVPLLSTLVEVQLAQANVDEARSTAGRIRAFAEGSGHPRMAAIAALAEGRIALAAAEPEARGHLERALEAFGRLGMPLEAARTRVALARALREDDPDVAGREAQLALGSFERLGAGREADEAAALVRELGGPKRTGPKDLGLLTAREVEVLGLLGEGLSNAEIAARLFISTKTAGNHVSNLLAKLHLRSRQEAAAYAVRTATSR